MPEKTSSENRVIAVAYMAVKKSGRMRSGVMLPCRRRKCGHLEWWSRSRGPMRYLLYRWMKASMPLTRRAVAASKPRPMPFAMKSTARLIVLGSQVGIESLGCGYLRSLARSVRCEG